MAARLPKVFGLLLFLPGVAVAADEKNTEIDHPAYRMSLPAAWSLALESSDDFWQYKSKDGRERISIILSSRPQSKNSLRQDFDEIVAMRREVEQNVEGKPMKVGETEIFEHKGVLHGAHAGSSLDNNLQTFTCFVMNRRTAIVVFYEARGLAEEVRDLRITKVLKSLELK